MNEIEHFFDKLEEPNKSVFLFLKDFILNYHDEIEVYRKWGLPYLYFKKKPLCYIWKDKKTNEPYLGFARGSKMKHPALVAGDRTVIKIFPVSAHKDIAVETLSEILDEALQLY
ncbi:DUF1801 domain-containing protein [Wenyingzhuangia sp. IMCC45574]